MVKSLTGASQPFFFQAGKGGTSRPKSIPQDSSVIQAFKTYMHVALRKEKLLEARTEPGVARVIAHALSFKIWRSIFFLKRHLKNKPPFSKKGDSGTCIQ